MRLAGAGAGAGMIVGLNTVRIGTLGLVSASPAWFNALHVYLWPALLILAIAGYVFAWMRLADRPLSTPARTTISTTISRWARWLETRPEVLRVLHPALETHPGHALWKRDFTGACGLFSVVLKPAPAAAVHAFLNKLTLFGIGASWGGFESLAVPFDCGPVK